MIVYVYIMNLELTDDEQKNQHHLDSNPGAPAKITRDLTTELFHIYLHRQMWPLNAL